MLALLAAARAVHFAATATVMGAVLFQYLVAELAFRCGGRQRARPGVRVYKAGLAIIHRIGLALHGPFGRGLAAGTGGEARRGVA
jgi:hypothetical protein